MKPDLLPLGRRQRPFLRERLVGNGELSEVVEDEAVLEARILEQGCVDRLG